MKLVLPIILLLFFSTTLIAEETDIEVLQPSMYPLIEIGDKLTINSELKKINVIQQGDIILYHSPRNESQLIGRVIAIENQKVDVFLRDISIDGKKISSDRYSTYDNKTSFGYLERALMYTEKLGNIKYQVLYGRSISQRNKITTIKVIMFG